MILQTAVTYFRLTQDSRREHITPDHTGESHSRIPVIPNIISSKIEHPAVNEYLEYLRKTGQAGIYICLDIYLYCFCRGAE